MDLPVEMDRIQIGTEYSRQDLASIWGYQSMEALARGVVTPAEDNKIILFVTHEKRAGDTQYDDHFEGEILVCDGELGHQRDARIAQSVWSEDEIFLFYRERHEDLFRYMGEYYLLSAQLNEERPSRFWLSPSKQEAQTADMIFTEASTHASFFEAEIPNIPVLEGGRRLGTHVSPYSNYTGSSTYDLGDRQGAQARWQDVASHRIEKEPLDLALVAAPDLFWPIRARGRRQGGPRPGQLLRAGGARVDDTRGRPRPRRDVRRTHHVHHHVR